MVKANKKPTAKGLSPKEIELEINEVEKEISKLAITEGPIQERKIQIKSSKPVEKITKGDKIKIDSQELEVDAHYVLIDHGTTKEMAIELFDAKTDKDYQLRYFEDQAEATLDLYELKEIIYLKKPFKSIEW